MALKLILEENLAGWIREIQYDNSVARALMSSKQRTTEGGNFVAFDKETKQLSYSPRRVDQDGNQAKMGFKAKGRVSGKPGRIARKFVKEEIAKNIHDIQWEAFTNSILALSNGALYHFGFVRGEDVRVFYDQNNYSKSPRCRIYSCMAGEHAQKYLDVYARNPNAVELFCCFDSTNNLLLGRSLVWNCTDGKRRYDTIYAGDMIRQAMTNELHRLGISTLGSGKAAVQLDNVLFKMYPSVDRLRYLDTARKIATTDGADGYMIVMTGTNGTGWYRNENQTCVSCKRQHNLNSSVAVEGKVYCLTCAKKFPKDVVRERLAI